MLSDRIYDFTQNLMRRMRTNDPYELAEQLGIRLKYDTFDDLKGVYFLVKRCPFIVLSGTLDEVMEKVVLSHEIGHHLLHRHLATNEFQEFSLFDMTSKPEMEANIFAANILLDDDEVCSLARQRYTSEQVARMLKVPHELLLIKMKDMNNRGYGFNLSYIPRADFLGS